MSCGYVEVRQYRNCCGSSKISVLVYCRESGGCGRYSSHGRWVNENCGGRGYYERGSC